MKTKKGFATATGATTALLCAVMLAPAANAQTVVVSNPTPPAVVAVDVQADMVGIELIPGGIVVTGHGGDTVQVNTKGQRTRTIKPKNAATPATFTKLTPGRSYAISVDGTRVATTTVLRAPGQTYNMVVQTTDDPGSVLMTWDYSARSKTGDIRFALTATPVPGQKITDVVTIDAPGTAREGVLSELDPHTLYKFSVAARNATGAGRAVDAVMTQSLASLTGADDAAQQAAAEAARKAAEDAAAQAAARPAPAPSSSSGGGGTVRPATKTIWECPSGFVDISGVCTQTQAYTFTPTKETSPYTYRTEVTGPAPILDTFETPNVCPSNYNFEDYGAQGKWCKLYGPAPTQQVKNAAPAGWSDNGSAYERTVQVKDATPTGWNDNGTQWIRTANKVAREVSG